MIPKECKRLGEVDFPIAKVSAHSAHEKSIRRAHHSMLHTWWARRPLAPCGPGPAPIVQADWGDRQSSQRSTGVSSLGPRHGG